MIEFYDGHIHSKRGKWYMVIYRRDSETGKRLTHKWVATGLTEKDNKRKAQEILRNYLREHAVIGDSDVQNILFADFYKDWLDLQRTEVEPNTFKTYSDIAQKDIIPYFKENPIKLIDLKPAHLDTYYRFLMNDRKDASGRDVHLSACTVKKHQANIHKCLEYAVRNDLIVKNPADYITKIRESTNLDDKKKSQNVYNAKQLKQLLIVAEKYEAYPVIYFIAKTGLRREEAIGLRWQSINFDKREFTVENVVVNLGGKALEKHNTKTKKSNRTLLLSDELVEFLKGIKKNQEQNRQIFGNSYVENDFVFTWSDGRPYLPDYITKQLARIVKENKLAHITVHGLRHSFASIAYDNGIPLSDISEWLGHSRTDTTQKIYKHKISNRPFIDLLKAFNIAFSDENDKKEDQAKKDDKKDSQQATQGTIPKADDATE